MMSEIRGHVMYNKIFDEERNYIGQFYTGGPLQKGQYCKNTENQDDPTAKRQGRMLTNILYPIFFSLPDRIEGLPRPRLSLL